ncbi:MAG: hypothetical protein A3J55_00705 [Candidatus Ryanbacteria bacterium RIFCSPHIGHO2_02_FULL_45_17b]|uniref:Nucleotidyl transferase AbiEii/AbiGii toxin family protein n=1 Tax=Candidatus Ryanbacteria bacterium RIFCSPHIGHO2_01_FULL_45_22 TaxID=1802114 RepID=A0A1G2G2A4_9BACT|nr:MAG: hypothetical protein A2719_03170 [Candidatus Ryanbacteria bacterium RIFCSPHIGHO2_01_FULL_45_22]OGZ47063.1 MAG: hypothetical protein A3J55_00705 [Candidatus Ryanbacteria bacterium RIFCSPHIGHO2_02_FULL_45_17b]
MDILTKNQITFLTAIGESPLFTERFYLTGGTPLAAFYLKHRYSEDLDFFSEQEINDVGALEVAVRTIQKKVSANSIDFQQSFNRNIFFIHFGNEVLKTEFTYYPFPRIETGRIEYSVSVDSILDIAVNKLFTIYQRTTARDYIDLYLICREKNYVIDELMKKAKIKFDWHIDPLQLGTQFIKAESVQDFPRMIIKIDPREWRTFFMEEAKKLKSEIIGS